MSLKKLDLIALVLLGATVLSSCGYNPKEGGGKTASLGFKGTVECLFSGCHDSMTAANGSYPGFNPAASWALAQHGNINAIPGTTDGLEADCSTCHDPASDLVNDQAFLFTTSANPVSGTALAAVGLTPRPMPGCEGCHGTGTEHYAYASTTPVLGTHRSPLDSTISPIYGNPYHLESCGPCHSPDQHAGGSSAGSLLSNQYAEWFGGDGRDPSFDDGHSDSLVVETVQGFMTSVLRGQPCAACHTVEGFVRFFAQDDTGWATSQAEIDRIVSETGDTDVLDPSSLPGGASLSQVSCVTCHPSHEPGNVIRSPFTQADVCLECHNVRLLQSDVGSGQFNTSGLETPRHPQKEISEGAFANTLFRAVELSGFTSTDSAHANPSSGCVQCHYVIADDVDLDEFPLKATTGHRFQARLEGCLDAGVDPANPALKGCHVSSDLLLADGSSFSYEDTTIGAFQFSSVLFSGVAHAPLYTNNDYDVDGTTEAFQVEILGMLENLKAGITAQAGYQGVMFDDSQGLFDLEEMAAVSATVRAAAYNYDFIVGDGSLGYHNPLYVIELLNSSINALP
jgi:predicted small secreted protein